MFGCGLYWLWDTGLRYEPEPIDAGRGKMLLPHPAVAQSPGWWGMIFTLVFDATFFASLLFGYLFLWTIAPNWPPPAYIEPAPVAAALTGLALALTAWAGYRAVAANTRSDTTATKIWLVITGIASLAAAAGLIAIPLFSAPSATEHAYGAAVLMLAAYGAAHSGLTAVGAGFVLLRLAGGFLSPRRSLDLRNLALFGAYAGASGAAILGAVHLMPLVGPL